MSLTVTQRTGKIWSLYLTSQRLAWSPAQVDLSHDAADWTRIRREHAREDYAGQLHRLVGFFHAGEESVCSHLAPLLVAASRLGLGNDVECFLTAQLYEEAKHFEFFERYAHEVLGEDGFVVDRELLAAPRAVLVDDLGTATARCATETDPAALRLALVEAATHYMGIVEAMLARTGYQGAGDALRTRGWLPGLQEGFRLIRRDEGRHVAFGIQLIRRLLRDDPSLAPAVLATFERHLPNVLATVQAFDVPHPIVEVSSLVGYALDAYQLVLAATGLADGDTQALEAELHATDALP